MQEDTSGRERQRLIVGLGNPGSRYRGTRHNLGFRVLDEVARLEGLRDRLLECKALVASSPRIMLAWPQTYMNRSGYAVRCLQERHGLVPAETLIVFDDVALPLGTLRVRSKGGPGGHRGMESVIENLRTDNVARLRLGIAPEGETAPEVDLSDYVLEEFTEAETETVEEMIRRAAAACRTWLTDGAEMTMSRYNG